MSIVAPKASYTMEEFLVLPDHDRYELVDGELVEINVSILSSVVGAEVLTVLNTHVKTHGLGRVLGSEAYYQCFPDRPGRARKPDVSFVASSRLPPDWREAGYFTIAPDLVVEVISPHDLVYDVNAKIREYLDAGVRMVWVIDPQQRIVDTYRPIHSVKRLGENDVLDGEDVVPGFKCRVAEFFP